MYVCLAFYLKIRLGKISRFHRNTMTRKINYGIDLGTTNSAIAIYKEGKVSVLRNPRGFREVLPSAIAMRKGRILIGDKARESGEFLFTAFKRDMGSDLQYTLGEETYDPLQFSSMILEQLIGFQAEETIESAVITIPASFDIVQSNATKKAGYAAGLKEVVLLQEPIAACLAYANENNLDTETQQRWLVYDFGGGTFDCALVQINQREMTVIDHQGNNFLGGVDMDESFLQGHILPELKKLKDIDWSELIRTNETLKKSLLLFVEEAKIELTQKEEAQIEIELDEPEFYGEINVSRAQFNACIEPQFNASWQLIQRLLGQNNLAVSDVNRIVLVGGTTYVPFIREELKRRSGIEVDSSIDPGTAIVKGAAYFAGSKDSSLIDEEEKENTSKLQVTLSYEPSTLDDEELIAFKVQGGLIGSYKILTNHNAVVEQTPFRHEASAFIPIQPKQNNEFQLAIQDEAGTEVYTTAFNIQHGNYSVNGQTLPSDICLELDELEGGTKLEAIFRKNALLPIKRTVFRTVNRHIPAGSEEALYINVLEGKAGTMPGSNLSIGFIEVKGIQLPKDLVKGMDIELQFNMTESRDLEIDVFIPSSQKRLTQVFNPHQKSVNLNKLSQDLEVAIQRVKADLVDQDIDDMAQLKLQALLVDLRHLLSQCREGEQGMMQKLDEEKRHLLKSYDDIVRLSKLSGELERYKEEVERLQGLLHLADTTEKEQANKLLQNEWEVMNSDNRYFIKEACDAISSLNNQLFFKDDRNYAIIFFNLSMISMEHYQDSQAAQQLIQEGQAARERNDIAAVKMITISLFNTLKPSFLKSNTQFASITGIR